MNKTSIDDPFRCAECRGADTMSYMPDNQGEMWLLCKGCSKFSEFHDPRLEWCGQEYHTLRRRMIEIEKEYGFR